MKIKPYCLSKMQCKLDITNNTSVNGSCQGGPANCFQHSFGKFVPAQCIRKAMPWKPPPAADRQPVPHSRYRGGCSSDASSAVVLTRHIRHSGRGRGAPPPPPLRRHCRRRNWPVMCGGAAAAVAVANDALVWSRTERQTRWSVLSLSSALWLILSC